MPTTAPDCAKRSSCYAYDASKKQCCASLYIPGGWDYYGYVNSECDPGSRTACGSIFGFNAGMDCPQGTTWNAALARCTNAYLVAGYTNKSGGLGAPDLYPGCETAFIGGEGCTSLFGPANPCHDDPAFPSSKFDGCECACQDGSRPCPTNAPYRWSDGCCYSQAEGRSVCPDLWTDPGRSGACAPPCYTPDCPSPYVWDPDLGLCVFPPPSVSLLTGPSTLHDIANQYFTAYCETNRVKIARAANGRPPFQLRTEVTPINATRQDAEPSLALDWRQRLTVVFTRKILSPASYTVYSTYSDDDAETWSTPVVIFSNARHPTQMVIPSCGCYVVAAFNPATNTILVRRQYPGDPALSGPFTIQVKAGGSLTNLLVSDDSFSLSTEYGAAERTLLSARKNGDSAPSWFVSTDDCETFVQVA